MYKGEGLEREQEGRGEYIYSQGGAETRGKAKQDEKARPILEALMIRFYPPRQECGALHTPQVLRKSFSSSFNCNSPEKPL